MDSILRNYLNKATLDNVPLISECRNARNTTQLLDIKANFVLDTKVDNVPWTIAPFCENTFKAKELLLLPDTNLLNITKFYFKGICSMYGTRPFESFILNETFNELGVNISRTQFLEHIGSWEPFLKDLIIDTCNYVMTGQRDINIKILRDMSVAYRVSLDSDRNPISPELNVQQRFAWKDIENMSSQEFFTKWVSHKYGIQDLICSYKVMLGL